MDTFYKDTYLPLVFKWSYYHTRKNYTQVACDIIEDTNAYHTVRFYLNERVAFLTVWHNGIIEEQITDIEEKEIYFYLHYTLKNLSQFLSYYKDFITVFLRKADPKHLRVGIVDEDGDSSAYLGSLMKESLQIEKSNLEVESYSLSNIEEAEGVCNALYLSPSIMHLKEEIEKHMTISVYNIDPLVYATHDFYTLIHTILSD